MEHTSLFKNFKGKNVSEDTVVVGRENWIDIAKGIGIILVVVGHCMPDASSPQGISHENYKAVFDIIYSFHMPLFFFISGYLAYGREIKDRLQFIKKYFLRLLIPYFFVGICYTPFKLVLSSFANKTYDIANLWQIFIGINPDGELWFLYALFIVMTVGAMFNKMNVWLALALSVAIYFTPKPGLIVFSHLNFLIYFILGGLIKEYYSTILENINIKKLLLAVVVFSASYLAIGSARTGILILCTAVAGIYLCSVIARYLDKNFEKCKLVSMLQVCGIFSMDIYILSDLIKIPFRILLWNYMHWYHITFIVSTVMAIWLSYIISTKIIRKSRLLRKLVLGESK